MKCIAWWWAFLRLHIQTEIWFIYPVILKGGGGGGGRGGTENLQQWAYEGQQWAGWAVVGIGGHIGGAS